MLLKVTKLTLDVPQQLAGIGCRRAKWVNAQLFALLQDFSEDVNSQEEFEEYVHRYYDGTSQTTKNTIERIGSVIRALLDSNSNKEKLLKDELDSNKEFTTLLETHLDEFTRFVAGLPTNYLDLNNQRVLREKVYKNHSLLRAHRGKSKKAASGYTP